MRRFLVPSLLALLPILAPAQNADEFQAVSQRYGRIVTVAGSGLLDDCNDWRAQYEKGPALSADLSRPHNAVADSAGNIYIADKEANAVRKVTANGRIDTLAGTGVFGPPSPASTGPTSLWAPNGVFAFPDGTLYFLTVNDNCETKVIRSGGRIHKVRPDGTREVIVHDPTLGTGRGLYVMPDERTIYYSSGTSLRRWTQSGGISVIASGFANLGNIDLESSGSLLVTDRGGHLVWRIQPDGSKEVVAGTGSPFGGGHGQLAIETGLNQVRGVAALDTGGFFVCTHKGNQVWYIDSNGYAWIFINPTGAKGYRGDGLAFDSAQVELSEPRNITIAPNGDLLITDSDDGYIRRVTNTSVEPRIVDLQHFGNSGLLLEWTSHREATYRVIWSTDLKTWTPLATIPGSNGPTSFFGDPQAADRKATYYRVQQLAD